MSGNALSRDKSGNLYYILEHADTLGFLSYEGIDPAHPNSQSVIFKLTDDTVIRWTHTLTSKSELFWYRSVVDGTGNLYLCGVARDSIFADTSQIVVRVGPLPSPTSLGFIGKIGCRRGPPSLLALDTTICWNETAQIIASHYDYENYYWNGAGGGETLNVGLGGIYCLHLMDENGCPSDTSCISITKYPRNHFQVEQYCDSLVMASTADSIKWWYEGNQVGQDSFYLIVQSNGWYAVSGVDTNSCQMLDSIYIWIQAPSLTIENVCDTLKCNAGEVVWFWNGSPVDTSQYTVISGGGSYYYVYKDSNNCLWHSDTMNVETWGKMGKMTLPAHLITTTLTIEVEGEVELEESAVFTGDGRRVMVAKPHKTGVIATGGTNCGSPHQIWEMDVSDLPPGFYIFEINAGKMKIPTRILKVG